MKLPLWLKGSDRGATVALSKCRNCGQVKVASRPCGFDHLAAVLEFNAAVNEHKTSDGDR